VAEINGGQLVARQLKADGIDTVFGVVAGPMLQVFGALPQEGIRYVGCRHEEQAAFMAQAYGYITKKPGIVVSGSGPGTTNTYTGLHVAQESGWPLVVLGGSLADRDRGLGGFQEADQVAGAAPFCKWTQTVRSAQAIPQLVHLAVGKAVSGRPGAVYLDFPGQVPAQKIDDEQIRPITANPSSRPANPDPQSIAAIADLLAGAQRPLITIGKGAAWANAAGPLERLVNLGIPFVASPMGRGTVPDDNPLCMGAARSAALANADAILMVGSRFNWMFQFGRPPRYAPDVRIAQIDVVPEELYSAANVELGVVADCAVATEQVHDALKGRPLRVAESGWIDQLREAAQQNEARIADQLNSEDTPIHPMRLWREVRDNVPRETTIVVDGEATLGIGRIVMPSFLPRHRLNSGTTGCMGTGVPYAIAAKLARPNEPVVAVLGDAAFGFSGMEIETAARMNANVVFVLSNNGGIVGSVIQRSMGQVDGPHIATLLQARYEMMAQMVGGYGEAVTDPREIAPAIKRAQDANTVAIVNVMTDPYGTARGGGYLTGG
jgi:thiamine pyrophosphate-dependent acetolactate synthase large subunit-like protein